MSIFISFYNPLMNPYSKTPCIRDGGVSVYGRHTVLKCFSSTLLTASLPWIKLEGRNTKGQDCQDSQCFSFVLCSVGDFNFKNPAILWRYPWSFILVCPPDDAMSQFSGLAPACLCNACLYWWVAVLQGSVSSGGNGIVPQSKSQLRTHPQLVSFSHTVESMHQGDALDFSFKIHLGSDLLCSPDSSSRFSPPGCCDPLTFESIHNSCLVIWKWSDDHVPLLLRSSVIF